MNNEDIELMRRNLVGYVTKMPGTLMHRNYNFPDYESDEKHLNDLGLVLTRLEQGFRMGDDVAAKVLGGEFSDEYPGSSEIPLYLYLDIIVVAIDKNMASTVNLDVQKKSIKKRIEALRERAAKLPHSPKFDPNKHLSESAQTHISSSRGNFNFGVTEAEGMRFVTLKSTTTHESYDIEHGDVYNVSASYVSHDDLAFQEDYDAVMEIQRQRKLAKWNEIMDAVRPYFKDGALPDAGRDVRDSLLDPDLDSSVVAWLYSIVSHLNHEIVRDDISLDECYEYFKEAVQNASRQKEEARKKAEEDVRKQVDLEKNVPKKKSIFERFRGMLGPKEEIPKDTAEETFETQRKKQMGQDEEIRNVVIYQRRVIDGKEVLVPLDNSEFKVVRR